MDRGLTSQAGFSLIELMVAVAVVAVLSTSVMLSVIRPGTENTDLHTFRRAYDNARAEAVLSQKIQGISIKSEGFQKLRWDKEWLEIGQKKLWRGEVQTLSPVGRDAIIEFAPSGQTTPLRIRLDHRGTARICATDGWQPVSCTAL